MVRANAAALLTDTFPLQNPDAGNEDIDALLQRQFDVMKVTTAHIEYISIMIIMLLKVESVSRASVVVTITNETLVIC